MFVVKNTIKKQTGPAWNFPQFAVSACKALFQNQWPFILLLLIFQLRINKIANKRNVNYHLSPSGLPSRIHPLTFYKTFRALSLSENFVEFFVNVVMAKFFIMVFRLTENASSQKGWEWHASLYFPLSGDTNIIWIGWPEKTTSIYPSNL